MRMYVNMWLTVNNDAALEVCKLPLYLLDKNKKHIGYNWKYQVDGRMNPILVEHIALKLEQLRSKMFTKDQAVLLSAFYGAGVGKSRTLNELPNIMKTVVKSEAFKERVDEEIVRIAEERIGGSHFIRINVSFEVHTPLDVDELETLADSKYCLGRRMAFNFLEEKVKFSKIPPLSPEQVIERVAAVKKVDPSRLTVVLAVDGIHLLHQRDPKFSSALMSTLSVISMGGKGKPLTFVAVAGTIMEPSNHWLREQGTGYQVKRLPLPAIDGSAKDIIPSHNPVIHQLMKDCGGYGRALQILRECLDSLSISPATPTQKHFDRATVQRIATTLRGKLMERYRFIAAHNAAVRAVMTGAIVAPETMLGGYSADSLVATGLFRWTCSDPSPSGTTLTCAWILLWILTPPEIEAENDYFLQNYMNLATLHFKKESKTSRAFEECISILRASKSRVFPRETTMGSIHNGAIMSPDFEDIKFVNRRLGQEVISHRLKTKSSIMKQQLKVIAAKKMVVLGTSSSSGDAVCLVQECIEGDKRRTIAEVHQYKLVTTTRTAFSIKDICKEREKACSENDVFIFITNWKVSKDCEDVLKLPPRTAVVGQKQFAKYFGPFASRMWLSLIFNRVKLDVNCADRSLLLQIPGVRDVAANVIISGRPYKSFEDGKAKIAGRGRLSGCGRGNRLPVALLETYFHWPSPPDKPRSKHKIVGIEESASKRRKS